MKSVNKVLYREMVLGVFQLSATVSCLSCADHKVKCAVSKSSARNRRVEVSLRSTATPCCPVECGSIKQREHISNLSVEV